MYIKQKDKKMKKSKKIKMKKMKKMKKTKCSYFLLTKHICFLYNDNCKR